MKHDFDSTIIRAYDIRGVFNQTLNTDDAKVIGHLIGINLRGNRIVNVGYDGRHSSVFLKNALIEGLIESNAIVNEIELGPTPMLYYSCYVNNAEFGIMITGSHNPATHNGFKIVRNNQPFFGNDLIKIAKTAKSYSLHKINGKHKLLNIKERYIEKLNTSIDQGKKLNVVWDSGNGAAGEIMKEISNNVVGRTKILFEKIDGDFPNHHPDPSDPENLNDVISFMKEDVFDCGIAFDGDGDRIGVVSNKGEVISGDILLLIYAMDILKKNKNSIIIGDVKCSQLLFDEIERLGGKSFMHKTGHSYIKNFMKQTNADLAGEMSGHIFFADNYFGFDDGLYAAVRLVNLLSRNDQSLSNFLAKLPKIYNTPEIRIECDDNEKFKIIEKIILNQKRNGKEFNDIDGIRVKNSNGWWLLRASNTQPAIILRCEANSHEKLNKIIDDVRNEIKIVSISLANQILT